MFLLLQIDSPIPERPLVDRVIYVFACNTRTCTEGHLRDAEKGAFSVILQTKASQETKSIKKPAEAFASKSFFEDLMDCDVATGANIVSVREGPEEDAEVQRVSGDLENIRINCARVQFQPIRLRIVEELIAKTSRLKIKPGRNIDESAGYTVDEANPEEGYEQMEVAGYDKCFKAFHTRVAHYPRQCVRYAPGTKPLFFSKITDGDAEGRDLAALTCDCTGVPQNMTFDLQLMPAILSLLPINDERHLRHVPKDLRAAHPLFGDGMEWGSVLVYTCHICCARGAVRVQIEK
jgi:hypothetical protein